MSIRRFLARVGLTRSGPVGTTGPQDSELSCPEVGRLLQQYLDGAIAGSAELDEATTRKVSGHLDDCRRCGLEVETYEAIRDSLERSGGSLSDEALARLRDFGGQLAGGGPPGTDPDPA